MQRQFTATIYLFYQDQVLLHKHPKIGKWLPPGGHLEPNETPTEAVRREVLEETGIASFTFFSFDLLQIDSPEAKSLPLPLLCLLEDIPPFENHPAHQHIDWIFAGTVQEEAIAGKDLQGFRWFRLEDLESIRENLLQDVQKTLEFLFGRIYHLS